MKVFFVACLFLSFMAPPVHADIIYFKDGMKTVCQQKAWEEDGQVKCEYGGWVLTYAKKDVSRIVKTNPSQNIAPSDNNTQAQQPDENNTQINKFSQPKTDGIVFYNPRRPFKYWTDRSSKHKNYTEAIQALAEKYNRPPEWIQAHMGSSNDLDQIHRNLAGSVSERPSGIAKPPPAKFPGIAFYNPRRPFPYWTGKDMKHKSYHEAIRALAEKYGQSAEWVQENMGNSNDLDQIHENLKDAK